MRKIILSIFLVLISLASFAQMEVKHLKFEDIPIDGKRSVFIEKLMQKNYRYIPMEKETVLQGEYGGYKDCYVCLQASTLNDNMVCVIVEFPACDTWAALSENYLSQKNILIQKYGQPLECIEKFHTDSLLTDDKEKIKNAWYKTKFDNALGTITLSIKDYWIQLEFLDKVNKSLAYYETFQHSDVKMIQVPNEVYKLFPTNNIWTFIKLNTRNGKMWQVQFDTEDNNRFETVLNFNPLVLKNEEENGRFTLYPTTNVYNFILLDQIDGRTWQIQWSQKRENRGIIPINDMPNN